jgi:hypothetical protein
VLVLSSGRMVVDFFIFCFFCFVFFLRFRWLARQLVSCARQREHVCKHGSVVGSLPAFFWFFSVVRSSGTARCSFFHSCRVLVVCFSYLFGFTIAPVMKTGNDLELLLSWYEIRDVLLGVNKRAIFKQALKIAESCQYPDAVWLTKLFTGRDVSTLEDAKNVFLESDDFRAPCFAAVILDQAEFQPEEKELLRRSADMGYGFAQSWMAGIKNSE